MAFENFKTFLIKKLQNILKTPRPEKELESERRSRALQLSSSGSEQPNGLPSEHYHHRRPRRRLSAACTHDDCVEITTGIAAWHGAEVVGAAEAAELGWYEPATGCAWPHSLILVELVGPS